MSDETNNKPPKFEPQIPRWMLPHYEAMPPHEKWKCDMASVQEQQNTWLMERAVEADKHRSWINQRVDELAEEVRPVVAGWRRLMGWKAKCAVVMAVVVIPVVLHFVNGWIDWKFGKERQRQQQQIKD